MFFKFLPGAILGGGFNDRIHPQIAPGNIAGLFFRKHGNLAADHIEIAFLYTDLIGERSQNRIKAQEVLQGLMIGNITDGGQFNFLALVKNSK